ncbi:hypothetical protein VNI00_011260 [Paramarasmius palmivorus]|uniref:Uncharacterized protein n=1 Tax=Paramarasmius palmivorus TaxID=297713 RepID=A0AAW0CFN6_9AGAR
MSLELRSALQTLSIYKLHKDEPVGAQKREGETEEDWLTRINPQGYALAPNTISFLRGPRPNEDPADWIQRFHTNRRAAERAAKTNERRQSGSPTSIVSSGLPTPSPSPQSSMREQSMSSSGSARIWESVRALEEATEANRNMESRLNELRRERGSLMQANRDLRRDFDQFRASHTNCQTQLQEKDNALKEIQDRLRVVQSDMEENSMMLQQLLTEKEDDLAECRANENREDELETLKGEKRASEEENTRLQDHMKAVRANDQALLRAIASDLANATASISDQAQPSLENVINICNGLRLRISLIADTKIGVVESPEEGGSGVVPGSPALDLRPAGNGQLVVSQENIRDWAEGMKRFYGAQIQTMKNTIAKLQDDNAAASRQLLAEEAKYARAKIENESHVKRLEAGNRLVQSQNARLNERLADLGRQLQAEGNSHGQTKEQLQNAHEEHDEIVKGHEAKHLEMVVQLEDRDRELEEMKTQLQEETLKRNEINTQLEHSTQRIEELIAQCQTVTSEHDQMKASLEERNQTIVVMTTKHESEAASHAQTREQLEQLRKEHKKALVFQIDIEERLAAKENELRISNEALGKAKAVQKDLLASQIALEETLAAKEEELRTANEALDGVKDTLKGRSRDIAEMRAKSDALSLAVLDAQRKFAESSRVKDEEIRLSKEAHEREIRGIRKEYAEKLKEKQQEMRQLADTHEQDILKTRSEFEEKLRVKEEEQRLLIQDHERALSERPPDTGLQQVLEEEITKRLQMRVRVVATLKNDFAIIQSVFKELSEARKSFCHGTITQQGVFELLDELGMQLMILRDRKQNDITTMSNKRKQESEEVDERSAKRQRT